MEAGFPGLSLLCNYCYFVASACVCFFLTCDVVASLLLIFGFPTSFFLPTFVIVVSRNCLLIFAVLPSKVFSLFLQRGQVKLQIFRKSMKFRRRGERFLN